ncbi:MAG: methyltransferase domain-containing protein [Planctomycetes bacterium]|nr:methyltransferase domain-containing protein [Planctomycetota bacterium]MCB9885917.1 methyltransferase domain-containing protein [Planctomycetota bacterium]
MDSDAIEREVRRLAPWYYRWDLRGVRTDSTPPCDDQGHRQVACPPIRDGFWRGKTVLDVACNEGAYGIGALGHGAASLVGFDSRAANVEKARFVAEVLGHADAMFDQHTCDSWIAAYPDRTFDVVMLCGILYHLRDPARTIADYCTIAREWVFVTCCVHGDEQDGYTWTSETENVAASDGALDSLMPNNANTLVTEFGKHGFVPVHVEEVCKANFWDGASLLLRRCTDLGASWEELGGEHPEVQVHLAPGLRADGVGEVHMAFVHRTPRTREVTVRVRVLAGDGEEHAATEEVVSLPARCVDPSMPASTSVYRATPLPASVSRPATIEARVFDGSREIGGARIRLA